MNKRKLLAAAFAVSGLILILIPVAGNFINDIKTKQLMEEMVDFSTLARESKNGISSEDNDILQSVLKEDSKALLQNTASSLDAESGKNTNSNSNNKLSGSSSGRIQTKQLTIGIIIIDKIKIKVPVVEGIKSENLRAGVGHFPGTAFFGQKGNTVLAGHRSYTFGKYFNRLDELVSGDIIIVNTKKYQYIYRVYEKKVVKPDDISVLTGKMDKNILTLITCTPIYVATHRLIVRAELKKVLTF